MAYYKIDNVPSSVSFEPLDQVERTLQNAKTFFYVAWAKSHTTDTEDLTMVYTIFR